MVQEIGKFAGFLNEKGRIRSKEELAKADSKLQKQNSEPSEFEAALNATSADRSAARKRLVALGSTSTDSRKQINSAANLVQDTLEDNKAAKRILRKQARVLRKLEEAVKSGDQEKADKLRNRFQELKQERAELADAIDRNNTARSENGTEQAIEFGDTELARISVSAVELSPTSGSADLTDPESIRQLRKEINSERQTLRAQTQSLRTELGDIRAANTEVDKRVEDIREIDSASRSTQIRTFDVAQQTAKQVSTKIAAAGISSLGAAALEPVNVNQLVLQSLFQ